MKKILLDERHLLYIVSFLIVVLLTAQFVAAETTPTEKLQKADELSKKSFETANEAKRTGDIGLARNALELATEATALLSEVVEEISVVITEVLDEKKKEEYCSFAQLSLSTHYNVSKAITQTIYSTTYIAQTSTSPKTVIDAKKIFKDANELIQKVEQIKNKIIEILRACGIEPIIPKPYKSLEEKKLKIKEIEPASPV